MVKTSIQQDLQTYNNIIKETLENQNYSTRKVYKAMHPDKNWIVKLKKDKHLLYKRNDIITSATEYFEKQYSHPQPQQRTQTPTNTERNNDRPPFLQEEIILSIKELEYEKCSGEDRIQNELLKIGI